MALGIFVIMVRFKNKNEKDFKSRLARGIQRYLLGLRVFRIASQSNHFILLLLLLFVVHHCDE